MRARNFTTIFIRKGKAVLSSCGKERKASKSRFSLSLLLSLFSKFFLINVQYQLLCEMDGRRSRPSSQKPEGRRREENCYYVVGFFPWNEIQGPSLSPLLFLSIHLLGKSHSELREYIWGETCKSFVCQKWKERKKRGRQFLRGWDE